jgi:hypothetical protein
MYVLESSNGQDINAIDDKIKDFIDAKSGHERTVGQLRNGDLEFAIHTDYSVVYPVSELDESDFIEQTEDYPENNGYFTIEVSDTLTTNYWEDENKYYKQNVVRDNWTISGNGTNTECWIDINTRLVYEKLNMEGPIKVFTNFLDLFAWVKEALIKVPNDYEFEDK